jgi:ribosome-binding protein aMBF1 (putative translation factor)
MARSYEEIASERRRRAAADVLADKQVFEHAYDIAVQVMELREKRGLTQAQLAERCGIDQADISRIERGSTSPTARTLQRIGEALDADVRLVVRASG